LIIQEVHMYVARPIKWWVLQLNMNLFFSYYSMKARVGKRLDA
jgi:hypothetical protein